MKDKKGTNPNATASDASGKPTTGKQKVRSYDLRISLHRPEGAKGWHAFGEQLSPENKWRSEIYSAGTIAGAAGLVWAAIYDAMRSGEVKADDL